MEKIGKEALVKMDGGWSSKAKVGIKVRGKEIIKERSERHDGESEKERRAVQRVKQKRREEARENDGWIECGGMEWWA